MADTGEDREIKRRVNAHQKEVLQEMKCLVQMVSVRSAKNKVRSHITGRPKTIQPCSASFVSVNAMTGSSARSSFFQH
jgi:hypothetical protein